MNIKKLNEEINSLLKEDLDKDVHYNFTIKKISEDTLKLTSGESEFEIYIRPEDDLQDIEYAIEDFVDGELAADEDDNENITGTEVVGFKYDTETGEGEFEATIFFAEDEDLDESVEEENEIAENKRKKRAYVKAYEALEDLQTVLEEDVDPATGLLDDYTDMLYQLLQKTINEIYSRSLAFD